MKWRLAYLSILAIKLVPLRSFAAAYLLFIFGLNVAQAAESSLPNATQVDSINTFLVNLSFLNANERPAGKHGFLKARGESLVFEDGTIAKFWGVNITAYALFLTPKQNIKAQARRLSALGVNLVRIHHHDSAWVSPNVLPLKDGELNPEAIEKIDWWIKCLKDEGIYVWLDLHVGRQLTANDHITAFDEIKDNKTQQSEAKGYNYINPSIRTAMKQFSTLYLNHINPYTGLAYKDEPAIATVLISNENDVTNHFGNILLPTNNIPQHSHWYMQKARAFADAHHLSFNIAKYFPNANESAWINRLQRLIDNTWKAWKPGPAKLFLADLEHQFNVEMIQHLRQLGVKVPIVTNSYWGEETLSALPPLTDSDMIDVHSYQAKAGALSTNPYQKANFIHWIATAQVADKPLSVSEWNADPYPTQDRHVLPLYLASQARLQGWDSLMLYAYAQSPIVPDTINASAWDSATDPSMMMASAVAALLFRRGDIKESDTRYVLSTGEKLFNEAISPDNAALIRTASEAGKLMVAMPQTPALPWLVPSKKQQNAIDISYEQSALSTPQLSPNKSLNGPVMRDWSKGILTINTNKSQAAAGEIAQQTIPLQDISITSSTQNIVIAVQSLDDQNISQSHSLLVTAISEATPAKNQRDFEITPVSAKLTIKAPSGLKSCFRGQSTQTTLPLISPDKNGGYLVNFSANNPIHTLILTDQNCAHFFE